jgi:acyl-coenzyme A thioesterase PaaI-like protein
MFCFLDHLSSHAIGTVLPEEAGVATIELQLAFTGAHPVGAVHGVVDCHPAVGVSRLLIGRATDDRGALIATCSAWFATGVYPGNDVKSKEGLVSDRWMPLDNLKGPFETLMGLSTDGEDGALVAPDIASSVGYVGLPAFHGGIIAINLAMACQRRIETLGRDDLYLAGITTRYLTAARADRPLRAVASCEWPGRRASHVGARSFQGGAQDCARAQALFLPRDDMKARRIPV